MQVQKVQPVDRSLADNRFDQKREREKRLARQAMFKRAEREER